MKTWRYSNNSAQLQVRSTLATGFFQDHPVEVQSARCMGEWDELFIALWPDDIPVHIWVEAENVAKPADISEEFKPYLKGCRFHGMKGKGRKNLGKVAREDREREDWEKKQDLRVTNLMSNMT